MVCCTHWAKLASAAWSKTILMNFCFVFCLRKIILLLKNNKQIWLYQKEKESFGRRDARQKKISAFPFHLLPFCYNYISSFALHENLFFWKNLLFFHTEIAHIYCVYGWRKYVIEGIVHRWCFRWHLAYRFFFSFGLS